MRSTALTVLAFATSAFCVSNQITRNYCSETKYLTTLLNATGLDGPFELPSGVAYIYPITGTGNSVTVTNTNDSLVADVPRLILGTSTDNAIVYWAVNNLTGDPFAEGHFNVTSVGPFEDDVCQHVTSYDGQVHACSDNDVSLILNLCSVNTA